MYNLTLFIYIVFLIFCTLSIRVSAAEICRIENVPIPELVEYQRNIETRLTEITTLGSKSGSCGVTQGGASAGVERTAQVLESASVGIAYFPDLLLDFSYNIGLAARGEARSPVIRDGYIFDLIDNKIAASINNLTNRCNLSDEVQSGFVPLMRENHILENTYKQAALGTPTNTTLGLTGKNVALVDAINIGYNQITTESCKDQNGTADPVAKLMKSIESIGGKNESVWKDWKKGIDLFKGGGTNSMSITEYNQTQLRLLQSYLARSGYSSRMAQTILGNFDCVKAKSIGSNDAESMTLAEKICLQNPILGLEKILLPLRKTIDSAKTTNERVERVSEYNEKRDTKTAILTLYSDISVYQPSAIDIKMTLMTNLIDIHLGLLSTAEQIEKRIPIMYKNCMKAQPTIPCPKP